MSVNVPASDPVQFVLDEAWLLNAGEYEKWAECFDVQGRYWVPLDGERQSDAMQFASLAYEDRFLLATRIARLRSTSAHSLQPGVRGNHVIQTPRLVQEDQDSTHYQLRTAFIYTEVSGERQTVLSGTWCHTLLMTPAGLRILLKRVNLLNAQAPHEAIQLFP